MKRLKLPLLLAAATAASPALAQQGSSTQPTSQQPQSRPADRIGDILGALFGNRTDRDGSTSIDAQWTAGRLPLAAQQTQFEARIESDVRSGALTRSSGDRARSEYRSLVELEARYGADRRFTTQERTDLSDRYGALTQALAEGNYGSGGGYGQGGGVSGGTSVADGRLEFEARVDEAVRARRLTRTQGTQLKAEYATLIRTEQTYLRDGSLSARERDDLESRLDALDSRVGDGPTGTPTRPADPTSRLEAIARALPSSGLSATARAQLLVEHEDLTRLANAYRRLNASAEEQAYLDRRLSDLETRARVRR